MILKLEAWRKDLEKALDDCRGKGEYDCLVPVSGGKDSIYLLYKLKVEYNLNVLAFTTNINIPDLAWKNIRRAIELLDIPHISYTPSKKFYTKLFRYLLQNQEERGAVYTVSYVYAPLFEGDAIKLALEKNIPLVLAGYSPGSLSLKECSTNFPASSSARPTGHRLNCIKQIFLPKRNFPVFLIPSKYPADTEFPRYLAPFHAWEYSQDGIMKSLVELGLVKNQNQANPIYTNYPINWLLMYSDLMHFGYNPYHPEFSALIREGKASRTYWKIMTPVVNFMIRNKVLLGRNVTSSLKWLGMTTDELKITKPKGAYDPVF